MRASSYPRARVWSYFQTTDGEAATHVEGDVNPIRDLEVGSTRHHFTHRLPPPSTHTSLTAPTDTLSTHPNPRTPHHLDAPANLECPCSCPPESRAMGPASSLALRSLRTSF